MENAEKMGFRETLGLLGYGFGLVRRLTPGYVTCVMLRSFVVAAQPLVVLFFSARIINQLAGGQDLGAILSYVGITVGLSFFMAVVRAGLTLEIQTSSGWDQMYNRMLMMQAEHFTQIDYGHTEDSKVSETLARMDTQAMGNGLGIMNMYYFPPMVLENLFTLILAVLLLTGLSAGAGITALQGIGLYGFFALGLLVAIKYRSGQAAVLHKLFEENEKANTAAMFYNEYIKYDRAAKDIRIYKQVNPLEKIFADSFNTRVWMSFFFYDGRINGFTTAVLSAVGGGFFLVAGFNALAGTGTIGGVVQSVGAAVALVTAIGTVAAIGGQLYNNAQFLKPMQEFLELPERLAKGSISVPKAESYQIEFCNVSFKYPGAEEYALRDLTMHFNAGERMALVGPNGSGKTTMIKLLCRLYDPTEGEILLNGINIKEYDYDEYTALFSVVFQDYELFPLWLGHNVAVADDFDADEIKKCLASAGFSDRLATMPKGLETVLYKSFDEDGTTVSGGEAQKIALARALYRDAPMVILDEPTAALDPLAEYEVYSTFDSTIANKTAVFISHRLSSCRFCHDIAVFEKGRLVQRGKHETLLADSEGLYAQLWDAQARHYV